MRGSLGWVMPLLLACAVPVHAENVALTFDDLPVFGRSVSTADATNITRKLLSGLSDHHLPATGFVNESQLERADRPQWIALLVRWLDAGMDLGNHSYSHLSLTSTPVDEYIADVAKGQIVTQQVLAGRGRKERWYRHPYLETGPTIEIRHRFETWLADHGYRVAPVTMENSDWLFADPYDDAVARGDDPEASRIRQAYLDYTARIIDWYRQAGFALLGRRPAFVFLLHASRLNADTIDDITKLLKGHGLHGVTLDEAVADPAYAIVDDYAGPDGEGWLTRWARTLHKDLPWGSLPHPPADIAAASARLDAKPAAALPN